MGWWIAVTAGVWPLILTFFQLGYAFGPASLTNSIWPTAEDALRGIGFGSVGVVTGLVQWLVLRRRVPRAEWWILANALGWGLVHLIVGASDSLVVQLFLGAVPAVFCLLVLNRECQCCILDSRTEDHIAGGGPVGGPNSITNPCKPLTKCWQVFNWATVLQKKLGKGDAIYPSC